jgi:hypothetical protein
VELWDPGLGSFGIGGREESYEATSRLASASPGGTLSAEALIVVIRLRFRARQETFVAPGEGAGMVVGRNDATQIGQISLGAENNYDPESLGRPRLSPS